MAEQLPTMYKALISSIPRKGVGPKKSKEEVDSGEDDKVMVLGQGISLSLGHTYTHAHIHRFQQVTTK